MVPSVLVIGKLCACRVGTGEVTLKALVLLAAAPRRVW